MKLKKIVIFFPNFERGGIEKISLLLAEYFISKKIKIIFISFRPLKKIFSNKNKFFVNINIFKTNSKFLEIILSIITLSKVLLINSYIIFFYLVAYYTYCYFSILDCNVYSTK